MTGASRRFLLIAVVVALIAGWATNAWTQGRRGETADQSPVAWTEDDDVLGSLTPLDRQILEFVNESQLEQVLNGTDPADVYLSNGETLAALAARSQDAAARNLLFAPVEACRLFDTRATETGALRRGETRGFRVRAGEDGYAAQGGAAEGCGLPGLAGVTLKTNAIRAIALNVMTVEVGGPGSLAIWPANRSEPEIGSVSYASAFDGGGVTGGVIVPVCDEAGLDPCGSGDLKIKAKISGAHVAAEVVGYFHASESGSARADAVLSGRKGLRDESGDSDPLAGASERTARRSPTAQAPVRPAVAQVVQGELLPGDPSAGDGDSIPQEPRLGAGDERIQNPLGGLTKIKAVLVTGEGMEYSAAIDAHILNDSSLFYQTAIRAYAVTGNGLYGRAPNGRAIYGQTDDGYAVYGFDGGSKMNRGFGGYFYSSNGIGLYGYSGADRTHPNIYAPGVYGQSLRGVGVYGRGDTSNSSNFYNEGGYFEGGRGLYARGTDVEGEGGSSFAGYGARFYSNSYRALYALGDSDDYDAHFDGGVGILVDGAVAFVGALKQLAVNAGATPIEPGDLVALAGVKPSPEDGRPMLAVARVDAANQHAVIGVAGATHSATPVTPVDGPAHMDFSPAPGAAPPLGYLSVVTRGLAPAVKAAGLGGALEWRVGDELALSQGGTLQLAAGQSESVSVGRIVSPLDPATGTVGIYVDVD